MNFVVKNLWWISGLLAMFIVFNFINTNPCDSPITYKLGKVDPGFKLSEAKLLQSIKESVDIWSKPVGKELFVYNPNGKLTLNLIYDERQKTTQQNQIIKADVDKISKLASSVKKEYEGLLSELERDKQIYNTELAKFQAERDAYSYKVMYWNERGGAPSKEYEELQNQRQNLLTQQQLLETKRVILNNTAEKVNVFINKYNLLVQSANTNIDTINETAGQEFQEGSYDPNTNTISIYEYSTQAKLNRVLAHELGHALGLNHNNDKSSIMYALNQSDNLTLSEDDLSSLKALCKISD